MINCTELRPGNAFIWDGILYLCLDHQLNKTAMALKEIAKIDVYSDKKKGEIKDMATIIEELGAKWKGFTDEQKAAYLERITEEWIAIEYWYVYLFYSQILDSLDGVKVDTAAAKAAFREALGYDAATGTYAKDVMLLERADITLAQWVESDFSEDLIQ